MKKAFYKKSVAVTVAGILLLSLLAWGIVAGNDDDDATTSVDVVSRFTISLDPNAIAFDKDELGGDYGDVGRGSTLIYADSTITATVTADVNYTVTITGTDMVNVGDPMGGGTPDWEVVPAANIFLSYAGYNAGAWTTIDGGVSIVEDEAAGEDLEHDVDFRLSEIPLGVNLGVHQGTLTFDLSPF